MIEINGNKYRNIQEQVEKNMEDIEDIKKAMPYPSNEYYTKTESNNKFVSKVSLIDGSINTMAIANSAFESGEVNIRAQSNESEYVRSYVSLDPNSIVIQTETDDDEASIGISATEIDLTAGVVKVNGNKVHDVYQHDMILLLADTDSQYAAAHIILNDDYGTAYTFEQIRALWSGKKYPVLYSRKQGSDTLDNNGHTRVYIDFSLDGGELYFEENEDFFSGSAVINETVNTYRVLNINDIARKL